MKKSILVAVLFIGHFAFSQTKEIINLLNKQFQDEQIMYEEQDLEKPTLLQPFQIQNDTLSFAHRISLKDQQEMHYYRQVYLGDITQFFKDVNVIFIAHPKSVRETRTLKNKKGEVVETSEHFTNLFFTELRKENDISLQKKMIKAFQKAGFTITSDDWYD